MRISWKEAVERIKRGEIVALPTETVYGLAASLKHLSAIDHLYTSKKRPREKPLTIHLADKEHIMPLARSFPPGFEELAQEWPGPLTLILPANLEAVPEIARAGLDTAGFRVPNHPLTLKILKETGPVVMPSANLSGEKPATTPEEIEAVFGKDFPVVESESSPSGVSSTIKTFIDDKWIVVR